MNIVITDWALNSWFSEAFLCEAYVKGNSKKDQRKMAKFKTHLQLICRQQFTECGRL